MKKYGNKFKAIVLASMASAAVRMSTSPSPQHALRPGDEDVQSINPLVGETNDGYLNDIRTRPVGREEVLAAIKSAHGGIVEEGSIGAGAGTVAFGFKGGVGSSSRKLPPALGGYTVVVL